MFGTDAPREGAPLWQTVAYWWSECYADAYYMTPDEQDVVKALAAQEVARLTMAGGAPPPHSFMAVVVAHIDSAVAAAATRGIRSFIDLMLCRERRAVPQSTRAAAKAAYADARRRAAVNALSGGTRAERRIEWRCVHKAATAAGRDARRRAKLAAAVAGLPSITLKLVGDALLAW